jgi:hypothetical protein
LDEYRFFSDTKGRINIFSRIFIERDAAGKPVRLIGSMMDITESKIAEERLRIKFSGTVQNVTENK